MIVDCNANRKYFYMRNCHVCVGLEMLVKELSAADC